MKDVLLILSSQLNCIVPASPSRLPHWLISRLLSIEIDPVLPLHRASKPVDGKPLQIEIAAVHLDIRRRPPHLRDVHAVTRPPPITLGEGHPAVPRQLEPENRLPAQLPKGPCRRLAGLDEGLRRRREDHPALVPALQARSRAHSGSARRTRRSRVRRNEGQEERRLSVTRGGRAGEACCPTWCTASSGPRTALHLDPAFYPRTPIADAYASEPSRGSEWACFRSNTVRNLGVSSWLVMNGLESMTWSTDVYRRCTVFGNVQSPSEQPLCTKTISPSDDPR